MTRKKKAAPVVTPAKTKGRSVAEFLAAHDKRYIIPRRITEALKSLGGSWEYEVEFLRRAGLSTTDMARYRDQFEEHIVNVGGRNPKRVWAGTVALANELRGALE